VRVGKSNWSEVVRFDEVKGLESRAAHKSGVQDDPFAGTPSAALRSSADQSSVTSSRSRSVVRVWCLSCRLANETALPDPPDLSVGAANNSGGTQGDLA
jgi:hypothetical protein